MYGIHPLALVDQIRDEVAGLPPFRIKFGRLGCFEEVEGGTADCVWVSVADSLGAGGLFALRRRLLKFLHPDLGGRYGLPPKGAETDTGQGGNEEDSEKPQSRKYIPHITLAYVIPGTAKQFVGGECELTGKEFTVSSIMVSTQSGQQHEVQLMGEGRGKYGPRTLDMVNGYRAWDIKVQESERLEEGSVDDELKRTKNRKQNADKISDLNKSPYFTGSLYSTQKNIENLHNNKTLNNLSASFKKRMDDLEQSEKDYEDLINGIIIAIGLSAISAFALYKWYQSRKAAKAKITQEEIEAKAKELKSRELRESNQSLGALKPSTQKVGSEPIGDK